jgi:2'-5' RNA ligase
MERKFSIVTFADQSLTDKIQEIQENLFSLCGTKSARDAWEPHITIGSGPIIRKESEIDQLVAEINQIIKQIGAFKVKLKGFSSTKSEVNGNVLFIKVEVNEQLGLLANKVKGVTDAFKRWYEQKWPYSPHVTLAFRDLTDEGLEKCLDYLSNETFENEILIDHISLVEKVDDKEKEFKRLDMFKE